MSNISAHIRLLLVQGILCPFLLCRLREKKMYCLFFEQTVIMTYDSHLFQRRTHTMCLSHRTYDTHVRTSWRCPLNHQVIQIFWRHIDPLSRGCIWWSARHQMSPRFGDSLSPFIDKMCVPFCTAKDGKWESTLCGSGDADLNPIRSLHNPLLLISTSKGSAIWKGKGTCASKDFFRS